MLKVANSLFEAIAGLSAKNMNSANALASYSRQNGGLRPGSKCRWELSHCALDPARTAQQYFLEIWTRQRMIGNLCSVFGDRCGIVHKALH